MDNNPTTVLLTLIGATWAAFNVLITTQKQLSDMRNVMVIGKVGNDPVSLQFRRHMLHNDWIPTLIEVTFISLAFGLIIFLAPLLVPEQTRTGLLWFFCAVMSLVLVLQQ